MTLLNDVDATEIVAVVSLLGMIAAFVSSSSGDTNLSLPADFGQSDSEPNNSDESDEETNPAGGTTGPEDEVTWWEAGMDDDTAAGDTGDYDYGGATGSDPAGGDAGTDDSTGGASPGDTTTGGTTDVGDTGLVDIDWSDVAGAADHAAGSTDEWVGRLW
ncbi:hypothetical protein ACOZ4L_05740 [Haloplanus ruber]|uniref:Uncharacterized protein n=1 Tax=Haloplanus ruber TaxID=869892 RepID=A0ABD6CW39_9EURY|nr:hypothetical protein [Haloplanus ruber]